MKVLLAWLMTFALLAPGLSKLSYVLYFHINQQAIAAAHCINKDIPELKCDGKCHLRSQMALFEEEKTEVPSPLPIKIFQLEITVFISSLASYASHLPLRAAHQAYADRSFTAQSVLFEIFSPPEIIF